MSTTTEQPNIDNTKQLMEFLGNQGHHFEKLNKSNAVQFAAECLFAKQQLMKTDYTYKAAVANPQALQAAILNVASIGISLNPALKHAYLVPRAPKQGMPPEICLDISYKGMVKLATDMGAIRDCKSVLVYENDTFVWKGVYEMPSHEANPFGDRGKVIGAYNIAFLTDGRVMVDTIDLEYINKVRGTSAAMNGPWKTWPDEMILKTATRHASKSWPQTEDRERFDTAIAVLDSHQGTAYSLEEEAKYKSMLRDQKCLEFYLFCRTEPEEKVVALYNSFAPGEKVKDKQLADRTMAAGRELAQNVYDEWSDLLAKGDTDGANEIRAEWSDADWAQIVVTGGGDIPEVANG